MTHIFRLSIFLVLLILLTGCAADTGQCTPQAYVDLSSAAVFKEDDFLPFRFPLDEVFSNSTSSFTLFCAGSRGSASASKYHAAEDYFWPAGTPVYAMADGEISFSGRMGGYGWLIIIDHPQANLYSLYGHLSPSRWLLKSGEVEKGDLIAYLGDSDENGGSEKNPLEPHLHLGVRAGQRADYSGKGDWRWQAGWINNCPTDLGWLRPSDVISSQVIPDGGFVEPAGGFWEKWGIELLFTGMYLFGATGALIYASKRNKPSSLFVAAIFLLVAGLIFYKDGWKMSYFLIALALVFPVIGVCQLRKRARARSKPGL